MGKFKDIINLEKQNMPDYQFKFLYKQVLPGMVYFIGGAILSLVLGFLIGWITSSEFWGVIPVIVWAIGCVVLLILFVVKSKELSKRLIDDKTRELNEKFNSVDYQKSVDKLISKGFLSCDLSTIARFPIEELTIIFDGYTLLGRINLRFIFNLKDTGKTVYMVKMDEDNYSFFSGNIDLIENRLLFETFIKDKRKFLQLLYRYNNRIKMEKALKNKK